MDEIFTLLNEVLPYDNVDLNNGSATETDRKIDQKDPQLFRAIEMKEKPSLNELKSNAIDLDNSYKNFIAKQKQLNHFRQEFTDLMKKFTHCKNDLKNQKV